MKDDHVTFSVRLNKEDLKYVDSFRVRDDSRNSAIKRIIDIARDKDKYLDENELIVDEASFF